MKHIKESTLVLVIAVIGLILFVVGISLMLIGAFGQFLSAI